MSVIIILIHEGIGPIFQIIDSDENVFYRIFYYGQFLWEYIALGLLTAYSVVLLLPLFQRRSASLYSLSPAKFSTIVMNGCKPTQCASYSCGHVFIRKVTIISYFKKTINKNKLFIKIFFIFQDEIGYMYYI